MFCPQCGEEYRPGFTHCSDCDVDLVEQLPVEQKEPPNDQLDNSKLVPVLSTRNMPDVINIKQKLDMDGIEYLMQGEDMMYIDRFDPVVLCVKEEDVQHVKELLKDLKLNYTGFGHYKDKYD